MGQVKQPVTLIMPYYENPTMLQEQYRMVRNMPLDIQQFIRVIVVDDGSPHSPALVEDIVVPLQLFRMDVDIRWNQDAARNVGVHNADTEWVLLTDIDHMVPERTWRAIFDAKLEDGRVYKFTRVSAPDMEPYKSHPNSWLLQKRIYDTAGGYDERFAGWYGTDGDFRDRITKVAGEPGLIKSPLIRVGREEIPDASTTQYQRKTTEDGVNIRRIKTERAAIKGWKTKTLTFPYHRVHP